MTRRGHYPDNATSVAAGRKKNGQYLAKVQRRERDCSPFIFIPDGGGLTYCLFMGVGLFYLVAQQGAASQGKIVNETGNSTKAVMPLTGSDAHSVQNMATTPHITTPMLPISASPPPARATPTPEYATQKKGNELAEQLKILDQNKVDMEAIYALNATPWLVAALVSMPGGRLAWDALFAQFFDGRSAEQNIAHPVYIRRLSARNLKDELVARWLSDIYEWYHDGQNPCAQNIFNTLGLRLRTPEGAAVADRMLEMLCDIVRQEPFQSPPTDYSPGTPQLKKQEILDRMIVSAFNQFRAHIESSFLLSEEEFRKTGSTMARCAVEGSSCVPHINAAEWYTEHLIVFSQLLGLPSSEAKEIIERMSLLINGAVWLFCRWKT
ncbi:MAG: hypothetical protein COV52_03035 [Gammaproteobacteria bacterium CG11_big_fil_rev_8_21_14_0_20_46_22]|nr:MAG: hypothetical protein COW05_05985 [Gammaproteobacteria bacterium CG12_big_fil_rev_8_21_14_0_65_46_12]PIR11606.1 MAG: hypothetical protein COV52_03035 [Gammaproteobacteria bacterium CG11_big_fil_rev_8_21_14_0_20_46_22]